MERGGPDDGPGPRALGDLARELRAGLGHEVRADAEEDERLAAQAALRRRSLADVAREAADRGETMTVVCSGRRFTGSVRHVARDLLSLDLGDSRVHVNLDGPVVLRTGGAPARPSVRASDDTPSFKARLYELEMAGGEVDLGLAGSADELRGRLRAVALDHVLLQAPDGSRSAVALRAIAWLRDGERL